MSTIEGVFPPITTPFEDGEVAHDRLAANIERWAQTGLAGLVVLGSNGEFPFLSEEEREAVVHTVVQAAPKHLRVVVGTGRESTAATIRATERAASLGADAAIVLNPHYYTAQMDEATLYQHYRAVAAASPIPIILYNAPPFTGINLAPSLVLRLAQDPKVVGIKDTSGNIVQIATLIRQAPPTFSVLAGSAGFFYASLALGAAGGILALANVAPAQCVEIYQAVRRGDHTTARELQLRLLPVNNAVTTRFSIAGLKAAMDMVGYFGGEPRCPLLPLSADRRREMEDFLTEAGLVSALATQRGEGG